MKRFGLMEFVELNGLIHDDCVAAKWSYGKADLLDLKIVFSDLILFPVLLAFKTTYFKRHKRHEYKTT